LYPNKFKFDNMKALYIVLVALTVASCRNQGSEANADDARQVSIDSMKMQIEKERIIDSVETALAKQEAAKEVQREVVVVNQPAATTTAASTTTTTTTEKKGWSSTAKGAVIGAGVGAATGAIISKKKGTGAIIGGLAGAGVGAGTGAIIDGKKK
jgi:hypothetical protein